MENATFSYFQLRHFDSSKNPEKSVFHCSGAICRLKNDKISHGITLSRIMAVSNEMPSCPATGYFYVFTKKSVVLWYLLVCYFNFKSLTEPFKLLVSNSLCFLLCAWPPKMALFQPFV